MQSNVDVKSKAASDQAVVSIRVSLYSQLHNNQFPCELVVFP